MRLGKVLRRYRRASDINIRKLAAEIGISHGTLSRIERGESVDGKTLLKILIWLASDAEGER